MTEQKLHIRLCTAEEKEIAMDILRQGKDYMLSNGLHQWDDNYPAMEDIEEDLKTGKGYFICRGEEILGYYCIDCDSNEECYKEIEGSWLTPADATYMVIHRLAFDKKARGQGLGAVAFSLAEDIARSRGIGSIRVDTHAENHIMQKIIPKAGYQYCGIVYYFGSPRTAFEKLCK